MSKFEERGVERQYRAKTIKAAQRAFSFSCTRCSTTGRYTKCKFCAIAGAHNDVINFVLSN